MRSFVVFLAATLVPLIVAAESHVQSFVASQHFQSFAAAGPIIVPTWFHVITNGAEGAVSDAAIQQQISVLNADYAGKVQFNLAGTTRQSNSAWFTAGPEGAGLLDYQNMKSTLRKGGPRNTQRVLCIQTSLGSPAGLLVVATFPTDYSSNPKLDGGSLSSYNLGRTATHEVGHWLGLYHTFQGGCAAPGDYVDDTPAEASPASGCPTGQDSCAGAQFPGLDPITNYMDYSVDSCMTNFTPGQYARIQQFYAAYRNTGGAVTTTTTTTTTKAATSATTTTTTTTTKAASTTSASGSGPVVGGSCTQGVSQCYNKTMYYCQGSKWIVWYSPC
ncbi:hypothetical protein BDR26DRAFT_855364 [Obelidium mucronatum]|nr:hypothetical protein BDR26DRAFT_855364 [Obelidium mucronatum]